ncbi:MAG TPA: amylo-alpha-1,6-glucosidase [Ktedonobacteraceae bacterium]|jgi:glycogen debranching enzyme
MPITFERTTCRNLDEIISREWLITNGLGGYAAGTIAGALTRMQQGLLVATLDEDTAPQLLLAKIDEEVLFDQRTYYLGTNEYRDGTLNPAGFVHLESFRLEEGFPIFMYRLGGADSLMLEKRIWMLQEQNTTCIQYRVLRTSALPQSPVNTPWQRARAAEHGSARSCGSVESVQPVLTLALLPFVAHRSYNQPQYGRHDGQFHVQLHQRAAEDDDFAPSLPRGVAGCTIRARDKKTPYHLLAIGRPENQAQLIPTGVWYWHFLRRHDQAAGQPATDDLYLPGVIRAKLWPEQDSVLTIIASTEELYLLPLTQKALNQSYEQALDYQRSFLLTQSYFGERTGSMQPSNTVSPHLQHDEFLSLLTRAGDCLLRRRILSPHAQADNPTSLFRTAEHVPMITPGYYHLEDSIREILIALPGLTVATRRYGEAQRILRSIARSFRQGLLPDHFPTRRPTSAGEDYKNADAALWYFYALDKYLLATRDYELLDEVYPQLADSVAWYVQGTYHGIGVDPADGLLRISATDFPLTWMNAVARGSPVTPRVGKPVEINALWHHALLLMHEWSCLLSKRGRSMHYSDEYAKQAEHCQRSFNKRFWYQHGGYLYDLIDGPEGDDTRLRPNQLLASSLRHAALDEEKHMNVLDIVAQHLVTPAGLRTLAPVDPSYQGQLSPAHSEIAYALHQGSAWPWLIGPYIDTLLKIREPFPVPTSSDMQHDTRIDIHMDFIWRKGQQVIEPFYQQMEKEMLGSISDAYSGDHPYTSGPRLLSALSIGEILRAHTVLTRQRVQQWERAVSV